MQIKITPVTTGNPPGKLAEAEIHFESGDDSDGNNSPLAGLKLIGFSIWSSRDGNRRNVTFPARSYTVNAERRTFALLRPIVDVTAQERIKEAILDAYARSEGERDGTVTVERTADGRHTTTVDTDF
jgi:hypothetical protein